MKHSHHAKDVLWELIRKQLALVCILAALAIAIIAVHGAFGLKAITVIERFSQMTINELDAMRTRWSTKSNEPAAN